MSTGRDDDHGRDGYPELLTAGPEIRGYNPLPYGSYSPDDVSSFRIGDPASSHHEGLATGDFNGDGVPDLAIGDWAAPDNGAVYVCAGPIRAELSAPVDCTGWLGEVAGPAWFGIGAQATTGNRGDNRDDLLISAPYDVGVIYGL